MYGKVSELLLLDAYSFSDVFEDGPIHEFNGPPEQPDRQAGRQSGRQADRQADRQVPLQDD